MASESKSICPQTVKSYIPICYSVSVPLLSPVGSCTLRSLYLMGILFLLWQRNPGVVEEDPVFVVLSLCRFCPGTHSDAAVDKQ